MVFSLEKRLLLHVVFLMKYKPLVLEGDPVLDVVLVGGFDFVECLVFLGVVAGCDGSDSLLMV